MVKKSDVYEQVYRNGKIGLPLITNYLSSSSKQHVRELVEDGYINSHFDSSTETYYVFLKDSYCVLKDKDDPNAPHYVKRLLKLDQKNDPPFNFMLNPDKVYENWLEQTNSDYINWMENNKEELDNMLNLPILDQKLKEDIDNFREEYMEYIKTKDWYIRNLTIDDTKKIVDYEIKNEKFNEKELTFMVKFRNYISSSNGMGYIQSIFYMICQRKHRSL
jgi:hypothetical protein